MENDKGEQKPESAGDQTPPTNEQGQEQKPEQKADDTLETLRAQKSHWREQAIDPETGKKYRELYEESKKSQKEVKTSKSSSKKEDKAEEFGLLQRTYLASNGVTDEDEINLAKEIQERTGLSWEKLPTNEYFKFELEKHRESVSNAKAADVDGGGSGGDSAVTESAEYWEKKGAMPTPKDVPDRRKRVQIIRDIKKRSESQGGKFYNE